MKIDPLYPFDASRGTVPSVVPFTIRENPSLLMLVEEMRKWISVELVPFINENIEEFSETWVREVDRLVREWADKVSELEAAWQNKSDELVVEVEQKFDQMKTMLAEAKSSKESANVSAESAKADRLLAEKYASEVVVIQVQNLMEIFGDIENSFRALLDSNYQPANPDKRLDIWEEFDVRGGEKSWDATDYKKYITGIDELLSGKSVKTILNTDVDGNQIVSYSAGNDLSPNALVVGGTHPIESVSMHAAMRFFTEFCISKSPEMVRLRSAVKIHFIPCLTPSGYLSSRNNGSGVDVNRNFDFYWKYYNETHAGGENNKGANPISEPSSIAIKKLIDNNPISLVIDCHVDGAVGNISWSDPSVWGGGSSPLGFKVKEIFERVYSATAPRYGEDSFVSAGHPTLSNWADHYMRNNLKRVSATSFIIEANTTLFGSLSLLKTSKRAMQVYCGLIHTMVKQWRTGENVPQFRSEFTQSSNRLLADNSKGLTEGGTLVNTLTHTPIVLDDFAGATGSNKRSFIDVPVFAPGYFEVAGSATIHNPSDKAVIVQLGVALYDTPTDGAASPPNKWSTVTIAPKSYQSIYITHRSAKLDVNGGKLVRASITLRLFENIVPEVPPTVANANLMVRWFPSTGLNMYPRVILVK